MKEFFNIKESYRFEIFDLCSLLTFLNVALILLGFWFAPIFGLINCAIFLIMAVKNHQHINVYITQISLIILNLYFLK